MFDGLRSLTWKHADTIEQWVRKATRGLCQEARERIADEIREHYTQALQAALTAGAGHQEAARRALETLGSPRKARAGFLKTNLSVRQAWLLNQMTTWGGWKRRLYLFFLYLAGLCMMGPGRLHMEHHEAHFVFIGVSCILFLGMLLLASGCLALQRRGYIRLGISIGWTGYIVGAAVPLMVGAALWGREASFGLAWLIVIALLSAGLEHIAFFGKLRSKQTEP